MQLFIVSLLILHLNYALSFVSHQSLVVKSRNTHQLSSISKKEFIPTSVEKYKEKSFISTHNEFKVTTLKGIHFTDITPLIKEAIESSGVQTGSVNVLTTHTTTALTINEMESRLIDDTRQYLLKLAPPNYPYLHNDIHVRNGPPDWPGGDEAWRAQEPINAHSHLLSMLIGTDKSIPIHNGKLMLGTWQSVIFVELDGPRTRTIACNIQGSN